VRTPNRPGLRPRSDLSSWLGIGLVALAAVLTCHSFVAPGHPLSVDIWPHLARQSVVCHALKEGFSPFYTFMFYCGFPVLRFYSPLLYLLAGSLTLLTSGNLLLALRILLVLLHLASALTMYQFLRAREKNLDGGAVKAGLGSALGTIVYLVVPWRTLYLSGCANYPQALVYLLLPLAFLALEGTMDERNSGASDQIRQALLLGLWVGLLFLAHLVYAIFALGFLAIWWSARTPRQARGGRRLLGIAALAGIGVSTFFLVPFVAEQASHRFPIASANLSVPDWMVLLGFRSRRGGYSGNYLGLSVVLLLLVTLGRAGPSLTIAYHRDDHAAPLFDACLYPGDFRTRYGLYLKQVYERESYSLVDGRRHTLSLRLSYCSTDSAVLELLLSGAAQVGILASDDVLGAVLKGQPVKVIAPLQRARDLLVVNSSVPAASWSDFVAWAGTRTRPTTIGYVGRYSFGALGLMQALDCQAIRYTSTIPGRSSPPVADSTRVHLVQADDQRTLAAGLSSGGLDGAVVQEPAATWLQLLRECHNVGRTDVLPPGRFEDRPGTVIAASDSAIRIHAPDISRFLELMAVATHYANNHTRNTLAATCKWLGASPGLESIPLSSMFFSSRPDAAFTGGIWNWYFTLRLRSAVPRKLAGHMEEKDWLGVPYDSLMLMPALERAGARIIR